MKQKNIGWMILGCFGYGCLYPDTTHTAMAFALLLCMILYVMQKKEQVTRGLAVHLALTLLIVMGCALSICIHDALFQQAFSIDHIAMGIITTVSFSLIAGSIMLILLRLCKQAHCQILLLVACSYLIIISAFPLSMLIRPQITGAVEVRYVLPWDLLAIAAAFYVVAAIITLIIGHMQHRDTEAV